MTQEAVRLLAVSALMEAWGWSEVAALTKVSVKAVNKNEVAGRWPGRTAVSSALPPGGRAQVLSEAERGAVRQAVLYHAPSGLGSPVICGHGPCWAN